MKLECNLPFSQWDYKLSGVYRLSFLDGCFYIGSSVDLRSRASAWERYIVSGKTEEKGIGSKISAKIRERLPAFFDIIELCSPEGVRDKEAFYLDKYKEDEKMLSSYDSGSWKAVLQYNKEGVFIKKHYSTQGAARYNNTRLSAIQRVLNGERGACNGMVFIYENDYHDRRKSIIKEQSAKNHIKYRPEKKNGRDVLMLNGEGGIIKSFKSLRAAAREVGCSACNIARATTGVQLTAGGFKWKYSEDTAPKLL